MSRKFSIVRTIDIDRIFNEIDSYIHQNGFDDLPYLFMNKETVDAIELEVKKCNPIICNIFSSNKYSKDLKDGIYGEFMGYKIFINNDLKFGIVEIR